MSAAMAGRVKRETHVLTFFLGFGTLVGVFFLDPWHDALFSLSLGVLAATITYLTLWLYRGGLLLSPVGTVVIGAAMPLCYTWGNVGARISGEGRYGGNPGSLAYYPEAAFLAAVGLATFAFVVVRVVPARVWQGRVRYQDLVWQPWQAVACAVLGAGLLVHLSVKYPFVNGYFRGVDNDVDRWLSAAQYWFVLLGTFIGVSVMVRGRSRLAVGLGSVGIALPLLLAIGLRSRTGMASVAITACLAWLTLRPRRAVVVVATTGVVVLAVFSVGTIVKRASLKRGTLSIGENIAAAWKASGEELGQQNRESFDVDREYRLAGLELPATILACFDRGAKPMYGSAALGGAFSALPRFLRSSDDTTERLEILRHFQGWGLLYGDSIGVPLSSGLADLGKAGAVLIYVLVAGFCAGCWRLVQRSPRLFVSYLMAGITVGDLFWENALFSVKALTFGWLIVAVTGRVVMPEWNGSGSWKPKDVAAGGSCPARDGQERARGARGSWIRGRT